MHLLVFSIFNPVFGVIQKKGNENRLCGRVICYVKIPKPGTNGVEETPFDALVGPDGVLAIQGDYSKNPDFDTFRSNLQQSLPRGLQEVLKHILEDDEIKENLGQAKKISFNIFSKGNANMGDFFPVPAQMVPFQSEEALLSENSDIFFLGEFTSMASAHLFLTGFPIIYQSKYKEQTEIEKEKQVDALLEEIDGSPKQVSYEQSVNLEGNLSNFKGNLLELLEVEILPKILYLIEKNDTVSFDASINSFRRFMQPYPHQQDIDKMVSILQNINETKHSNAKDAKYLTLLCKKIVALNNEEFEILPEIQKELDEV